MNNYSDLSQRKQINQVRKKAIQAISYYDIKPTRIKCFNHGYNTTFKIDTSKKSYSLRLAISTSRSIQNMYAEHEWMSSLYTSNFRVPKLIQNNQKQTLTILKADEIFKPIGCTMMEWLPGKELATISVKKRIELFLALGRQTAMLHQHGQHMVFTQRAELQKLTGVFWSKQNRVKNFRKTHPHLVDKKREKVFLDYIEKCHDITKTYWKNEKIIPIHADLHQWNIKVHKDKLTILDFDDCGLGYPAQDISVTLYYHIKDKRFYKFYENLLSGYCQITKSPFKNDQDIKYFLQARAYLLLNEVVEMKAAPIVKELPKIFENIEKRILVLDKMVF